jgi:hypothetical protein
MILLKCGGFDGFEFWEYLGVLVFFFGKFVAVGRNKKS